MGTDQGKEVASREGRRYFIPHIFPRITQGRDCKNTNIFSLRAERCFGTQKVQDNAALSTPHGSTGCARVEHTVVSFTDKCATSDTSYPKASRCSIDSAVAPTYYSECKNKHIYCMLKRCIFQKYQHYSREHWHLYSEPHTVHLHNQFILIM